MTDLPLAVEPVIGYRTWLLTEDRQLRSVIKQTTWANRPAVCIDPWVTGHTGHTPPHPAPQANCQCGYWLISTYPRLQQTTTVCYRTSILRSVRGVATGWGRTVVCEHGWRVEHAKPMALLAWPERRDDVSQPFVKPSQDATHWNDICKETADTLGLYLFTDPDELIHYADGLRDHAFAT